VNTPIRWCIGRISPITRKDNTVKTSSAVGKAALGFLLATVAMASVGGAASAQNSPAYTVTDLGTLGGTGSVATAINDAGQVVGKAYTAGAPITGGTYHAFLYSGGVMQDLGTLGGPDSYACGINNAGQVVGSSNTPSYDHAFLYSGGVMQDLGTLPGMPDSGASAINNLGQIVGESNATDGTGDAFLYSGGIM
jgi:probable HAF family extracellular repeat protein